MLSGPQLYDQYIKLQQIRLTDSLSDFIKNYKHVLEIITRCPSFEMVGYDKDGNEVAFILASGNKIKPSFKGRPDMYKFKDVGLTSRIQK